MKANAELGQTKHAAMYKETQELIRDDGGALVPMFANYIMGISNKFAYSENTAAN